MKNLNIRNKLVDELNHLIKEHEDTWYERIFVDASFSASSILCDKVMSPSEEEEEKEYWNSQVKKLDAKLSYYEDEIDKRFDQIRVLDATMISEDLKDQLLPLPEWE